MPRLSLIWCDRAFTFLTSCGKASAATLEDYFSRRLEFHHRCEATWNNNSSAANRCGCQSDVRRGPA